MKIYLGRMYDDCIDFSERLNLYNNLKQMLHDIELHTKQSLLPGMVYALYGFHIFLAVGIGILMGGIVYSIALSGFYIKLFGLLAILGLTLFLLSRSYALTKPFIVILFLLAILFYYLVTGNNISDRNICTVFTAFLYFFMTLLAPFSYIKGVIRNHFRSESGTEVADPDEGLDDTAIGFDEDEYLGIRYYFDVPVERREFALGFGEFGCIGGAKSYNIIADVMNRHWKFHWRRAPQEGYKNPTIIESVSFFTFVKRALGFIFISVVFTILISIMWFKIHG